MFPRADAWLTGSNSCRPESPHVPSRRLSQSNNLTRRVRLVDVEKIDVRDEMRASPLFEISQRLRACWNVASSFLRHVCTPERISCRPFTRSVTFDGAKLCLSTACTNAIDFLLSGNGFGCKSFEFFRSVICVSVLNVSSSTLHRS
jgi:hypothetical protein